MNAVVIPAYNASKTIAQVIESISEIFSLNQIIVVDDGSQDDTAKIASKCGVSVIQHPKNLGKGAALQTGMRFALENGYAAIITMDADGQHNSQAIPHFLEKINSDIIIGTRNHTFKSTPFHRFLSNKITSLILSIVSGQRIHDSQSGFRLIRARVIRSMPLLTKRYEMESEILIRAGRLGFSIDYVSVNILYSNNNISHIQPVRDTWRFIILVFRSFFW